MNNQHSTPAAAERDLAPIATLIGDPTRIAMLAALTEGCSLPAGDLARRAGVHPATAIEALAQLAPAAPVRSLRTDRTAKNLAEARTCYDHLAGRRGVQLRDRLLAACALRVIDEQDHQLTDTGRALISDLGVDPAELDKTRRVFARTCVDWTSADHIWLEHLRRHSLAG